MFVLKFKRIVWMLVICYIKWCMYVLLMVINYVIFYKDGLIIKLKIFIK